jgi:uncharacterized protein (DUF934 family)
MELKLFLAHEKPQAHPGLLELSNEDDPLQVSLEGVHTIRLKFPKFTDGRAFSQAVLLRKRRGFEGDICACGEVLIDQLIQIARTGFTSAELRADQDISHGQRLLGHFKGFYQGDALNPTPAFARV